MNGDFLDSPAALRVHLVFTVTILLVGALALVLHTATFVRGFRLTVETTSATQVEGRVFWQNGQNDSYDAARSVPIRVPAGKGRVTVLLPMSGRLRGLRIDAPGVTIGRVDLIGDNGRLRADSPGDLDFGVALWARRFPTWK